VGGLGRGHVQRDYLDEPGKPGTWVFAGGTGKWKGVIGSGTYQHVNSSKLANTSLRVIAEPSARQLMRGDPVWDVGTVFCVAIVLVTASVSADTRIAPTAVCSGARSPKHLKHETWIFPNRLNRRITGGVTMCGPHRFGF
jgi:hypothetical protein